ncbi:ABC transporter substrate-binding protein [Bacillus sp. FJAT-45350]|uniref:ABC transporter substrate-binding protein n=1 Tax=Bacillus sp. FJAT-45350 TaxID=2011014 RepID=UPI000BB9B232|nr:ABC transporter substrate-binding protein [Bacillus sp. FJAT-45350]
MKKWKKILGLAIVSVMALTACGTEDAGTPAEEEAPDSTEESPATQEEQQVFAIGATQIVEHPSLDAAFEGFKAAIADAGLEATYDFQSAQGDQNNNNTIAQKFVADNVDLIFANSTPSALGALNVTDDIPIIFTSVTDPVGSGLVSAMNEAPGANITGVSDLHPESIQKTIDFIDKNFEGSKVGLIYNSGEQNSVTQTESVEAAVEGTSLEVVKRTVSTSAEVQQAAESLVGNADVFFVVTDNTVVSALEVVIGVANDYGIPLVVGEPDSLKRGGFATYGIDYYTIGYRAGEMAAAVLKGEKSPGEIGAEFPPDMQLFINKEAAELQGVEWNDEWEQLAEFLETETE